MEILPTAAAWLEKAGSARFPLAGNCAMGRSSSNKIIVADERTSRYHATIHAQDTKEFWLIDLGSINGTQLNDRRVVQPQRLKDGDRITIADTTFVFHQPELPDEAAAGETLPTRPEVRAEKRWLLLADIEGFTALSQRLPAEELATLVGRWVRRGRETVEGNGGTMNKYLGDGYLACWPSGAGFPARVAAAVAAFRAQWEAAEPKFRVMVHHGAISLGGTAAASFGEESLMGPELNFVFRAEKIAAQAGAAFCFTAAAFELLSELLTLEPIAGRYELKGFPGSYEFFTLRL